MSNRTYRVTEVVGTSPEGIDDAIHNAAAADDQSGIAGLDLCGVFHSVVRRRHAAADDACLFQRQSFRQFEDHVTGQREIL